MNRLTSTSESSDEDLVARRDLTALYRRYARRLLPFLATLGVAEDDLEDVHHDVWLRVSTHLLGKPFEGHFRGWLFQIARNGAVDYHRKHRPQVLEETVQPASPEGHPLEGLVRQERLTKLEHCLGQLKPAEVQVIRAKLGGEDYDSLSQRLGIPVARAHRLFFDAKEKLTACVERADA